MPDTKELPRHTSSFGKKPPKALSHALATGQSLTPAIGLS